MRMLVFGLDVRLYCLSVPCGAIFEDIRSPDELIENNITISRRHAALLNLCCMLLLCVAAQAVLRHSSRAYCARVLARVLYSCGIAVTFTLVIVAWQRRPFEWFEPGTQLLHSNATLRVVLCLYGVVPRSIRTTWPTIDQRVVQPLRLAGLSVDIYVFNMHVRGAHVDGVTLDHDAINVVPYTALEEANQTVVTDQIVRRCTQLGGTVCRFKTGPFERAGRPLRKSVVVLNALRQLYSEEQVGEHLRRRLLDYDVAIVCGSDVYPALEVDVEDVRVAARTTSSVFTTVVQDAEGYTNGFYLGHPLPLSRTLRRWEELPALAAASPLAHRDYERLLKAAFMRHHIRRLVTAMAFFKVRASGEVSWQGAQRLDYLSHSQRRRVRMSYRKLCLKSSAGCTPH